MQVVPLTRNREGIPKDRVLIDPKFHPTKKPPALVTAPRAGGSHTDDPNNSAAAAA